MRLLQADVNWKSKKVLKYLLRKVRDMQTLLWCAYIDKFIERLCSDGQGKNGETYLHTMQDYFLFSVYQEA